MPCDGYLVERLTPRGRRLYSLMAGMSGNLPDELRALLGELVSDIGERVYLRDDTPAKRHDISVISAPVFDHYQRQVMVASIHIGKSLTDAEITERARALVATADAVTQAARRRETGDARGVCVGQVCRCASLLTRLIVGLCLSTPQMRAQLRARRLACN